MNNKIKTKDEVVQYIVELLVSDPTVQKYIRQRIEQCYKIDPNNDDDELYYRLHNNELGRLLSHVNIAQEVNTNA